MNNLIHIPVENSGKDKEDKKGICNASSETLQMPTFFNLIPSTENLHTHSVPSPYRQPTDECNFHYPA